MTDRFTPATLHARVVAAVTIGFGLVAAPGEAAHAQGAYSGTWHVSAWKVAPWVPAAERASIKPNTQTLNHNITFAARKISGPTVIACAGPKYEIKSVAFDQLFEGGLKQPATDARALGFTAPVNTLMPGCDMEFHSLNANTAMFALDNVLYTMVRTAAAKKP